MTTTTVDRETGVQRTPLYDLHTELGAKLVPFAGYLLPVSFPAGILHEHAHTRRGASLFDVSHMGLVRLAGAGAAAALEALVPADLLALPVGRLRYTVLTNEQGGIRDDIIVANRGDYLELVINAAVKDADIAWLTTKLGAICAVNVLAGRALLALQGPASARVLARLAARLPEFFMHVIDTRVAGVACSVSRSGYTGEDGFEILADAGDAERLARRLLAEVEVEPAGLGARDSLRLEAGLPLYGHDLDEHTTPVEAGLDFVIGRARRRDGARPGGFPGAAPILAELQHGPARRRVGLRPQGRAPVRADTPIVDAEGAEIGRVTSGTFGASVDAPVAMGYVTAAQAAPDTRLAALVRGAPRPLTVVPLPFVPHRYQRPSSA
ncbi:MAG: glycine cleavage system aminomethyltransferase GcvT [Gammaproteobacteria bacterium]|nr:glycine cleavage system aminomethyltransferase GcvT [Gammaproteobacteria bacterium]